uniref:L27-1 domain-containing protein n=1 Tax=Cyanoderma ruficeps TaxID=181631 RepID=A0A8C3QS95_9PASS
MLHPVETQVLPLLYQSTLRSPEEQELKASIGKVSHIFQSELFQALLGKPLPCSPLQSFAVPCSPLQPCV